MEGRKSPPPPPPPDSQSAIRRQKQRNADGKYKVKGNQPPSVKPSRVPTVTGHVNQPASTSRMNSNKGNEIIKKESRKRKEGKGRRGKRK
jgi:hypothetical protein